MNSKTRTRILYEDPNSIFKANKKVFLHELQGSTLKSKKPLPDDIEAGLKTADIVSKLIRAMSSLQTIVDYFYSVFNDAEGVRYGTFSTNQQSVKDGSSLIGIIKGLIKQLMKVPQDSFSEDDIFAILQAYQDMNEKIQYVISEINNRDNRPIMEPFFFGSVFSGFIKKMQSLFSALQQLLPYTNISGSIQNIAPNAIADVVREFPPEQPDAEYPDDFQALDDEYPDDFEPLDGAGRRRGRLLRGSGRYKVLSNRAHIIQSQPYKRFL